MPNSIKTIQRGFSLIELMIVVAILGILAAVAVPAFTKFMYNSKSAEIPSNFDGIIKSEQAYYGSNDQFRVLEYAPWQCTPSATVGKSKCITTIADFANVTKSPGFVAIQFAPSGNVYGQYFGFQNAIAGIICPDGTTTCTVASGGTTVNADYIVVEANTNIDGDANVANWSLPMGIATASGDIFVAPKIAKSGDDF